MFAELDEQLSEIASTAVEPEIMAAWTLEDDFNGLAVDLLIEVGLLRMRCGFESLPGDTKSWSRDQAIVAGNVVRLYKLISALLDQTCQRRWETSFIFARLCFETIVNIVYLVRNNSSEVFDSYVRYSMRHEKQLYDRIQENIRRRGNELPIEHRMMKSIERAATRSGIAISEASASQPKGWGEGNFFERAKEVGLEKRIWVRLVGHRTRCMATGWICWNTIWTIRNLASGQSLRGTFQNPRCSWQRHYLPLMH